MQAAYCCWRCDIKLLGEIAPSEAGLRDPLSGTDGTCRGYTSSQNESGRCSKKQAPPLRFDKSTYQRLEVRVSFRLHF
uniref:Uncharacterized protein n=1 Tax=Ixodes ricinus TaxID=34613 RepID=A0A6B0TWQ8_IXORI